jgi:hypothetical protein
VSRGDEYRALQWFSTVPGGGDGEELLALVPNEELDDWNAANYPDTYPDGTHPTFIDVAAIMAGTDTPPTPEPDPRPTTGPGY